MGERGSRGEMEAVCGRCEQYGREVAVWGRWGNMGERGSREEMEAVCGRCEQYGGRGSSMGETEGIWGRMAIWGR